MKITKLHIEKYKHLENLDFDFTYQSGDKKGQPLEKICFIGQSATGKTNLLELIKNCFEFAYEAKILNENFIDAISHFHSGILFNLTFDNNILLFDDKSIIFNNRIFSYSNSGGTIKPLISDKYLKEILYLKSNLISDNNIKIFSQSPVELFEILQTQNINLKKRDYLHFPIRSYDNTVEKENWLFLLSEILDYRKKFNQKMSELIHKGLLADTKKLQKEFENWQNENPNSLEQLANKLNPLLEKLHLEVDIVNTEYSIPIKRKNSDEVLPIQNTSTGTKGLLLSFLPLYQLRERESVVLIDEPERSLYPDMQIDLMDNYRNIAPNSQFIVATHSPFIAAAFEPDERFILYFDKEGNVKVKRGSSPIGDDPNDILYNDFGLETLLNKTGQEIYDDYLKKKQQVLFEENPVKKEALQKEIEKIGDKYDF